MNRATMLIKNNKDKYTSCNFCLSQDDLYTLQGDKLQLVSTICFECMTKISELVLQKNLKPNELRAVNRNEAAKEVCDGEIYETCPIWKKLKRGCADCFMYKEQTD